MKAEPERVERLRRNGTLFLASAKKASLDIGTSLGLAVIPIMVGGSKAVMHSNKLCARGLAMQRSSTKWCPSQHRACASS